MIAVLGTLGGALGGVALSFVLQFFYQKRRDEGLAIRERAADEALLEKKREAIENELSTNAALLPQKKDLLLKIQKLLCQGKLLRSPSVCFPAYCYSNYIGEVTTSLTSRQRENLVIIYETLRIIDEYMDNFHSEYMDIMKKCVGVISFRGTYIGEIKDLQDQCSLAELLINKYLAGKPIKIAWDQLPQVSRRVEAIPKEK